ncbi:enoyl-CoA hydratase-related protein [Terricaulis sp.]|uniref:enoyl-CoA hydratase-related protein n=1 Tax=Terricaulis sp. TaxID=2768686 RepID=UPI003782EAF3
MSKHQFISVERDGHTLILTLNRPEVMNALHAPAHFECHAAIDAFAADPSLWVLVITGAGERAFSAGNDLKFHAAGGSLEMPPSGFGGVTSRFDLNKPVIAAVNGLAFGGGFEVALATDIIIASSHAVFALPEPRVGLAALAGGLHRLPRAIGLKRAMGMILTARRVSAEEGFALGFVHAVTEPGAALATALQLAREIEQCSPAAIRAAKSAVMRGADMPLADAIAQQWQWPDVRAMRASPDAIEGPRSFAEKRPPNWSES